LTLVHRHGISPVLGSPTGGGDGKDVPFAGEIVEGEADIEAKRWRQAELAAISVAEGTSRRQYAREVGKSDVHIGVLVRTWQLYGAKSASHRPRWADAYATAVAGEPVTQADVSRLKKERQVPTRHEDRVEMATTLLADPVVAKAAVRTVMSAPSHARRAIDSVVFDANADRRRQERERAAQRATDEAMPLPAYMSKMVSKMNEWSLALAGLYDDLDELPEGRGRELVAMAAEQLEEQAHRWVDKLTPKADVRELRVIEGKVKASV